MKRRPVNQKKKKKKTMMMGWKIDRHYQENAMWLSVTQEQSRKAEKLGHSTKILPPRGFPWNYEVVFACFGRQELKSNKKYVNYRSRLPGVEWFRMMMDTGHILKKERTTFWWWLVKLSFGPVKALRRTIHE